MRLVPRKWPALPPEQPENSGAISVVDRCISRRTHCTFTQRGPGSPSDMASSPEPHPCDIALQWAPRTAAMRIRGHDDCSLRLWCYVWLQNVSAKSRRKREGEKNTFTEFTLNLLSFSCHHWGDFVRNKFNCKKLKKLIYTLSFARVLDLIHIS